MNWSKEKKILAIFIVIIVSVSVGGAVTILGIGENEVTSYNANYERELPPNANAGDYMLKIESNAQWVAYIIVDGDHIQKTGTSNATVDLGHVDDYASITVDQTGIGTTTVSLINSDGDVIDSDNTNEAETNALFFYLRMSK